MVDVSSRSFRFSSRPIPSSGSRKPSSSIFLVSHPKTCPVERTRRWLRSALREAQRERDATTQVAADSQLVGTQQPEEKTRTKEFRCKVIAVTRILTGYHRERDHRRRRLWTCGGFAGVAGSAISERVATLPAASGPDGITTAGPVMAIGGAEDKLRDKLILSTFVNLAGGPDARVAIVPTASSIEEAGERYKALFLGMGAESADVLYLPDRAV